MNTGVDQSKVIADSRILYDLSGLITNISKYTIDDVKSILGTFGALISSEKQQINISKLSNITSLLLFYASPLSLTIVDTVSLIRFLYESSEGVSNPDEEEANDIEEFAHYLAQKTNDDGLITDELVVQAAQVILQNLETRNESFGFNIEGVDLDTIVFHTIQKRLWINSIYIDDIELPKELLSLDTSAACRQWYASSYVPFKYYWDNHGSIAPSPTMKFHEFSQMHTADAIFESLISPVDSNSYSNKLRLGNWMSHVIIPALDAYTLDPLRKWMFEHERTKTSTISEKQHLWNIIFNSLITADIPFAKYEDIVETYIVSCYYDTTADNLPKVSSMETLKVLDLIKETVDLLVPVVPQTAQIVTVNSISYDKNLTFNSIDDFKANTPLRPLLVANKDCVVTLSETIETCRKLYPINQTTVAKFLELKYTPGSHSEELKREVTKLLLGLTPTSSQQLLHSLNLFKNVFTQNDDELEAIDGLVVDRFLFKDLFEYVNQLYDGGQLKIKPDNFVQLLLKKFWDSVNQATNFDERIGKLHSATSCITLFNKLSANGDLTSQEREEVTRLKHLMKVFANIRNFKLQFERSKAPTPLDIIKRFGSLPAHEELRTELEAISPMGLITTILEQNLKSYLAFEKLFKVLSDFLLFLKDTNVTSSYYFQRLMAACIEASLIDNNFSYAYKKSLELLSQYEDDNLNNMWMTFYQVGNYKSPDWAVDETIDSNRVEVLLKQSEILSKYLRVITRADVSTDNSRIIVEQWEKVNHNIDGWYQQVESQKANTSKTSTRQIQENFTSTANEILGDAANTTAQASEKLSNLFVSGLGWAIGANPN
ncbi:hypothetical protein PSN45_004611 [Yamadazyma tenuis]|uniref:Sec39 domain-containing protein n=1 Tax=Candida tenuis (strain ATCC 10573 / BCRC 21748 / CBS 615 / JCM 9827 / NBRC 10315 / NRRL Y-1498 / VKM Y-70) TaxID=590646 RepID=G3B525_CANTC|nr:uncharacterized protein CANTEDRAFT_105870 [Yamadazyma tenuis ATCC 10573]EGV63118.1 hypothetical protein CANTEDRAFT_105870 [Yamadazyma tenuis ATCC 10573]WEJ97064.1 hypothetical protein PSN45_004611 [Yamadazyma tenuis]